MSVGAARFRARILPTYYESPAFDSFVTDSGAPSAAAVLGVDSGRVFTWARRSPRTSSPLSCHIAMFFTMFSTQSCSDVPPSHAHHSS